jgi:hypothetical protein
MNTEMDILDSVRTGELSLPPVKIEVIQEELAAPGGGYADLLIEAEWEGERIRFVAEVKKLATPRALDQAMAQARRLASPPETYPMVIVPYLSSARLEELEKAQVSGLDLCGNGVVVVPGRMLVFKTGQPNRFPQSAKIRNVYRGKNSIVARAFLIRPEFAQVKEIVSLLAERQGAVAFSTVSKVLQRLEDDLVISREKGPIRVIQPETLLDNLAANYESPTVMERFRGKCSLPREEVTRRLTMSAAAKAGRLVLTGASSAERYAAMAGEPVVSFYCTNMLAILLSGANIDVEETDRFANLELFRTNDERVFFDTRVEGGAPYASPVQTWLELATGDKRQKDAAGQVRRSILASLGVV